MQLDDLARALPIVDFIHVLSYVYNTAMAIGEEETFGWGMCLERATACWQGRVGEVIGELCQWIARQEPGGGDLPDDDPRRIVERSITYLTNNVSRMDYPRYCRLGLPLTSSELTESCVKEINYRAKGTEKFWNDPAGGDAILALKAASLSDDSRLAELLQTLQRRVPHPSMYREGGPLEGLCASRGRPQPLAPTSKKFCSVKRLTRNRPAATGGSPQPTPLSN